VKKCRNDGGQVFFIVNALTKNLKNFTNMQRHLKGSGTKSCMRYSFLSLIILVNVSTPNLYKKLKKSISDNIAGQFSLKGT
jgi:hypothetical protein